MIRKIAFNTEHEAMLLQNTKSIKDLDVKFDHLSGEFGQLRGEFGQLNDKFGQLNDKFDKLAEYQHRDGILREEMQRGIELILEAVDVRHEVQEKQNRMASTLEKHDNRICAIESKIG